MSTHYGPQIVSSWQPLSHGVSNNLLNEDLSLAMNGFVMRPRLRDLLSLLWYGLDHKGSSPVAWELSRVNAQQSVHLACEWAARSLQSSRVNFCN
jgi:hypothetical protein